MRFAHAVKSRDIPPLAFCCLPSLLCPFPLSPTATVPFLQSYGNSKGCTTAVRPLVGRNILSSPILFCFFLFFIFSPRLAVLHRLGPYQQRERDRTGGQSMKLQRLPRALEEPPARQEGDPNPQGKTVIVSFRAGTLLGGVLMMD